MSLIIRVVLILSVVIKHSNGDTALLMEMQFSQGIYRQVVFDAYNVLWEDDGIDFDEHCDNRKSKWRLNVCHQKWQPENAAFPKYQMPRLVDSADVVNGIDMVVATPTSNFQPIRLLDPDCSYKFTFSTDLDLHCLQRQGISGFSRTRVN